MEKLFELVAIFVALSFSVFTTWALYTLFAVPAFSLPALTWPQVLGLGALVGCFSGFNTVDDEAFWGRFFLKHTTLWVMTGVAYLAM